MKTVCCIEDDKATQRIYQHVLSQRGYRVLICGSAQETYMVLDREIPDLFIVDLRLPDVPGLRICESLHADERFADIPFVVVSASADEGHIIASKNLGAADYLVKPFKPAELLAKINVILSRQALSQLNRRPARVAPFAGKYQILRRLGAGGSGIVYSALDLNQDPPGPVALKVVDFSAMRLHEQEDLTPYFLREAYQLSRLNHPNIVRLHDFGRCDDGRFFLAMEFVHGEPLQDVLETYGHLEEHETVFVGYEVAGALLHLLEQHLVHRDITPRNIMITQSGGIKLIDFGLARTMRETILGEEATIAGTPLFIAPEVVAHAAEPDIRADLYSLGVTLFACLCSLRTLYSTRSESQLAHPETRLPLLSELNPAVSPELANLIYAMTAFLPEQRPPLPLVRQTLFDLLAAQNPGNTA